MKPEIYSEFKKIPGNKLNEYEKGRVSSRLYRTISKKKVK